MMSLYLKSLEAESPEYLRTQMQLGGAILPSLGLEHPRWATHSSRRISTRKSSWAI